MSQRSRPKGREQGQLDIIIHSVLLYWFPPGLSSDFYILRRQLSPLPQGGQQGQILPVLPGQPGGGQPQPAQPGPGPKQLQGSFLHCPSPWLKNQGRVPPLSARQHGHTELPPQPVSQLLFADFKEFHIAGHSFGVSQITCVDSDRHLGRKEEFMELMEQTKAEHDYSMMLLMLTDVLLEGSKILCLGGEDIFQQAFNVELKDHEAFLPRVMSRKKQIVPMLSALWG